MTVCAVCRPALTTDHVALQTRSRTYFVNDELCWRHFFIIGRLLRDQSLAAPTSVKSVDSEYVTPTYDLSFSVFRLELKTYLFRQPILHGYYFAACVNEHVIAIAFRPVTETYGKPNMRKVIDRNRFETHLSVCTAVFLLLRSATKQNIIQ